MKYTVVWSPEAENELAEVWIDAVDRQAITVAQEAIDNKLSANPGECVTHVAEGLYLLRVPPLQVLFEIHELDRLVAVTAVRHFQS